MECSKKRSHRAAFVLAMLLLCHSLGGLTANISAQEPDSLILELISQISDSSYAASIRRLQAFSTRYELSDSIGPAGQWLYDKFISMGYQDVNFDIFTWIPTEVDTPIVSRNIIAMKVGAAHPESLVLVGGHYDSISFLSWEEDPNAPAPGADDNASGVAGVLEIARLLHSHDFEKTLIFACFAGEEVGMGGSSHYSSLLEQQGYAVRFSIVLDMIAYREDPSKWYVNIDAEMTYLDDAFRMAQLGMLYSNFLRPFLSFGYYGSDHVMLARRGPAVAVVEEAMYSSPLYHTPWDVLDSLDIPYATEILHMALASAVDAAKPSQVGIKNSEDGERSPSIPNAILYQNYPNPFNPTTTITFKVPGNPGKKAHVNLTIYDLRGRRVETLMNSGLEPGNYSVVWDARDGSGEVVPSGIYLYSLGTASTEITRKMMIVR